MTAAFTAIFAAIAAALYVPAFALLEAMLRGRRATAVHIVLGIVLAPATWLLLAWRIGEFDSGPIPAWGPALGAALRGSAFFCLSGAVFGSAWARGRVARPLAWPNVIGAVMLLLFALGFLAQPLLAALRVPLPVAVLLILAVLALGSFAGGAAVAATRRLTHSRLG